jgi:TolA-binding protein
MSIASMYFGLRGEQAAGDVMKYVTAGGGSTPYEEQFSHEQALVMKEDYAGAAACFEQRLRETPGDPRILIAAADLNATFAANPTRAAEQYREVQRSPVATPGQDVYASNKLADLYLGPLRQPGRALVEFRRLIQRYPNSRTADQARMALANLKPDLVPDGETTT